MSNQRIVKSESQTDEGYVEQRFDEPPFMTKWTDEQKAEFAYQLLLCIPTSKIILVVDRLSPLLHRDIISQLPYEIAIQILFYLDLNSLKCMTQVNKKWKLICEDQALWRDLFALNGWKHNQDAIDHYLSIKPSAPSTSYKPIASSSSVLPLARTTAIQYDPTTLPKMPGAPNRLKPFKRSSEILQALRSRSASLRPTQVSRSQPLKKTRVVEHLIVERPFLNKPMPRRHNKYDESAIYHYKESFDALFINWKRLYQNRHTIEKRWTEGKYKKRHFPPFPDDIQQHNGGIYCLQFNHHILVTGSRDRNLKVWDIKTGKLKFTLEGHSGSVLCLQFDHRYLITGSSDSTLIFWDIHTGEQVKSLIGHGESVLNVKFKENTVVSCSKDRTVRIWDLEKGTLEMTLRGHRAAVNAVQFRNNTIVSASGDRTIKIWDMNGKCLNTLDSHSRGIACVEYDGTYIISGSSDQSIRVWNASSGECIHTLAEHTDLVRTLQLDSESKRIVSGSYDGTLRIWDLESGKLLKTIAQPEHGRILNLQFDYGKIVCCSNLGKIIMYDFTHGIDTQFLL